MAIVQGLRHHISGLSRCLVWAGIGRLLRIFNNKENQPIVTVLSHALQIFSCSREVYEKAASLFRPSHYPAGKGLGNPNP